MITGRQIRAARGLLDWDATMLADKAGLTRATVGRIESGAVQPQEKTLASIIHVFDLHGIEFLEDEGLRVRKNQIRIFTGKAGYKQFLDHVYDTLNIAGGRICQFNIRDGAYSSYDVEYVDAHMQRMERIEKLDARVLVLEGDNEFPAKYCTYRWLDRANKILIPYYVYGDYVAMPTYNSDNDVEVISIHSKLLSGRYVDQFDLFWDTALVPGKKRDKS